MSTEDTIIEQRQDKHQQLNGGTYPLALNSQSINDLLVFMDGCELIASIHAADLVIQASARGRVMAHRKLGSINFIKISDGTNSIQIIVNKKELKNINDLSLLDLGDIIEVDGYVCKSKTDEKSLLMSHWTCLTKAHRPPPQKFDGVSDPEIKYRKRYLDLMSSEESRARFMVRSQVIAYLRGFFVSQDYMEVETSTLNSVNSGANAKPFITHHNALDTDLYLRIAPELYLKRLLVGGLPRVFEIGRAYRNEGLSTRHNPEFTLVEAYKAYGKFPELITMTQDLLSRVDQFISLSLQNTCAHKYFKQWRAERTFTLSYSKIMTMRDAVLAGAERAATILDDQFNIDYYLAGSHDCSIEQCQRQDNIDRNKMAEDLYRAQSVGERIAILFDYLVEPFLTEDYRVEIEDKSYSLPVFITEYPTEICPLARPNEDNPNVCDRFELFLDGKELANAFQELNDPKRQADNFKKQLTGSGKDPMDYDADYIEALEYGMPPCIGFGMGIDRLAMLLTNASSIKDVILFPTLRPQ